MNAIESLQHREPMIEAALAELRGMILSRYPDAKFSTRHGDDPVGVYLRAEVDVENLIDVVDVVLDRLVDMQVDEGLPIELVPVRPIQREIANLRRPTRTMGGRGLILEDVP